jgi:hypothetical protein
MVSRGESSITVEMPVIDASQTGGSAITSYNLQHDQGAAAGSGPQSSPSTENFVSLVGEIPDNNVAVTTVVLNGLNADTTYSFRYRTRNKHGWSGFSDILEVLTATIPAGMSPPSFSIESSTPTSVTLTWAKPYSGGNAISAYIVQFQHGDSSTDFSPELSYCDGSDLAVLETRRCTVPFTVLRAAPFNLSLNQLVAAKIAATNAVG